MDEAAIWAAAALAAAGSGLGGFLLGRRRGPMHSASTAAFVDVPAADPAPVLEGLIAGGVVLDLTPGRPDQPAEGQGPVRFGEPLARCLPRRLDSGALFCELLDCAAQDQVRPGLAATCFFAPARQGKRTVNAFEAEILALAPAAEPPSITLKAPTELLALPRRRHARKRVSDPRFVRLGLWLADAAESGLHFPDAAPDIWINAYDGSHGEENAVTDISPGGLALELRAALVPQDLEPGSPVVLKCALFQFKEKRFRIYWYAGLVRNLSEQDGRMRRIAVGFTAVGEADASAVQGIRWTERTFNEIRGGTQ